MRGLFANWKELQHTGVCLRNIHLNTKLLTLLTHYIASPAALLRDFVRSRFAAQICGVVRWWCGGDAVVVRCSVVWLQIIMRFDRFIIFILCLIQYGVSVLVMTNQLQYMFDVLL